jgi:hypothetical protein
MIQKIFITLLFLVIHYSSASQSFDINSIINYPHDWIGFTDSIKFGNYLNSLIDRQGEYPTVFRNRIFLIRYLYNKIKKLKVYFRIKYETIELKRILDIAELYYEVFFVEKTYFAKYMEISFKELMNLAANISLDLKDDENIPDHLKASKLSSLLDRERSYLVLRGPDSEEILDFVDAIIADIKSPQSLHRKNLDYITDMRLFNS